MDITARFLKYVSFCTTSDEETNMTPSTPGQMEFAQYLRDELKTIGLQEVELDDNGYIMATLPANTEGKPTIGFIAHMDTAPDASGKHIQPRIVKAYDGKDIVLNEAENIVLEVSKYPEIQHYTGQDIIVTNGKTLLGADDKAGVAIIMEAVKYLVEHPEVKRPTIEVYFTPDEETGSGMDMFPYDKLKSQCCYTVDGEAEGEVEIECFNAATVDIHLKGVSIHLGSARGIMVNAVTMASHIVTALPQAESPEATDGRYGYYCPLTLEGTSTEAKLGVFIRDFDKEKFEHRIESVKKIVSAIEALYGGEIKADVSVSYHNMAEANKKNPGAIEAVYVASRELGLPIREEIIRGGTDGARLAETGVSCPNLYTGGHNLHSLKEWIAVDAMSNSVNLCLGIIDYWSKR